jgi:hypothetical protein
MERQWREERSAGATPEIDDGWVGTVARALGCEADCFEGF